MAIINANIMVQIKEKMSFLKKNPYLRFILCEKNRLIGNINIRKYSDEEYIKKLYKHSFGKEPNLVDPKTFNEKLQWIKLNYNNPIMEICADKYAVREYLKNKGYEYLLNQLYGVYENVNNIDIKKLPNKFVMKATHGSGWNIICKDKSKFIWPAWKRVLNSWLKQDLYVYGRERVYKNIKPRIVCEKYFEIENGELFDYKFFCINGQVEFIQATDNDPKTQKINLYDVEWNLMKEKYAFISSEKKIPRPRKLNSMVDIAKNLSSPFPFARIDLYDINGTPFFGEITFFPSSGFKHFSPEQYDLYLGKKLKINNIIGKT